MKIEFSQFQATLRLHLQQCHELPEQGANAALQMSAKLVADPVMSVSSASHKSIVHDIADESSSNTRDIRRATRIKATELATQLVKESSLETYLSPTGQLLADYVLQIADELHWYQRKDENNLAFNTGHANAQIIGPAGLFYAPGVIVGVTVMQPQLCYPNHNHPPEEVYIILSEGMWWQEGASWSAPGVNGYVYNSPNITHAMTASDKPLLALWCLNL
ncbi:MAG: dimethylsulfonioproprionate lyase family protein [Oceanospirillaceae bacterium]